MAIPARKARGQVAFCSIEQQRQDTTTPSGSAKHVGGANVAASTGTNIPPFLKFYDEVSEGNRSNQVGEENQEECHGSEGSVQGFEKPRQGRQRICHWLSTICYLWLVCLSFR